MRRIIPWLIGAYICLWFGVRTHGAMGDNSPPVPASWNTGHPRFLAPSPTFMTSLFSSGTPWTNYQNSANQWDNCVTFPCAANAGTMPAFRALLISYMTWKQTHSGTCSVAPCTTWKANIMAMEQMGPTWAREWATTATGTGDGAGNITFPGANLNTACNGGSCTGLLLVATGFRYVLTVTGTTTGTLAKYVGPGDTPYPFPNGTNLTFNVLNTAPGAQNFLPPILYALMYDWIFADFSSAQQQYMAASMSNYATEMENQFITAREFPYNDQFYANGAASWEAGPLVMGMMAMAVYNDAGAVNSLSHLRWFQDLAFNVMLPPWKQVGFDGGWHDSWSDYIISSSNPVGMHGVITSLFVAYANASGIGITNFFNDPRYSWIKNWWYQTAYEDKPDGLLWKNGDTQTPSLFQESVFNNSLRWQGFDYIPCLGEIYNDPTIRGWGRVMTNQTAAPDGFEPSCFPFYTPDAPGSVTNPGNDPRVNLPLARNFAGVGWLIVRSGWTESDSWFGLHYGDVFFSHPEAAQPGHFELFNRGNMLITSGTYVSGSSSAHHFFYYLETPSKNLFTILDPADSFTQYTNGPLQYESDNSFHCFSWPNNGGQRRTGQYYSTYGTNASTCGGAGANINTYISAYPDLGSWYRSREFQHKSNLIALTASPNFTSPKYVWASLDLTPAYNNGLSSATNTALPGYGIQNRTQKCTRCLRDIVVIPNGHGMYVVVNDRISSTNANFVKAERWHTINQPSLSSGVYTTLRTENAQNGANGGLCYPFLRSFNILSAGNCPSPNSSYQYAGKLVTVPVYPLAANLNLYTIGGAGHESDDGSGCTSVGSACSNGVNWLQCQPGQNCGTTSWGLGSTFGEVHPDPAWGIVEAGSWRIEETPKSAAKDDYFLTVHYVTNSGDANVPSTITGSTGGSGVSAFHQASWTVASCTWTVQFLDHGVGGLITAVGAGCANTI